jgi:hypothetical protein
VTSRELVTRDALRRRLVLNAATKPVAVGAAAAVAVAAFVLGAAWLLAVAVVLYVALAVATFLDGDEAERVGRRVYEQARGVQSARRSLPTGLSPEIAGLVERARAEEARILRAIDESGLPFGVVAADVAALTGEMERIARRAQLIWDYRAEERPDETRQRLHELRRQSGGGDDARRARERAAAALEDRLRAAGALDAELERFVAEMEHLIASLGVVHAQLVRMRVAEEAGAQDDVAGEVRDLRERVGAVAESMDRTVAGLGAETARRN